MRSLVMMSMVAALRLQQPLQPTPPPPVNNGPIGKIITLLQDMQAELSEGQKKDQEVFEKQECYCETSEKEKTAAIAEAEKALDEFASANEENTAKGAKLDTEIKNLKEQVEVDRQSIATAEELRAKESAEFETAEKELVDTLDSVTRAVTALAGQHGEGEALLQLSVELKQRVLSRLPGAKSYNARSGEIFGILKQMKDDFAADLNRTRTDESRAIEEFETLTAAKNKGIDSARARTVKKTQQLTEATVALAQGKHDVKDTQKRLDADTAFLVDLKVTCAEQVTAYEERQKERSTEIAGVNDALKILTDDAARDLMGSALGFVQTSDASRRKRVVAFLEEAAQGRLRQGAIAHLASRAKLDAFTKVKAEIDTMITQLKKDQKDEDEHRDWCDDEFRKNDVESKDATWQEEDQTKLNNKLAEELLALDATIEKLTEETAAAEREIKHASEDRQAANADFQQTVADQRGAVQILNKVLTRLREVYQPSALAEERRADQQAEMLANGGQTGAQRLQADAAFLQSDEPYKKNEKSSGVLGLLEKTIGDCEKLQQEATMSEQQQQTAYEKLVKELAAEITANRASLTDAQARNADAEAAKTQVEVDLEATAASLKRLQDFRQQVHSSCDFVVANFDLRRDARANEVDSLENAKAILSGADFGL